MFFNLSLDFTVAQNAHNSRSLPCFLSLELALDPVSIRKSLLLEHKLCHPFFFLAPRPSNLELWPCKTKIDVRLAVRKFINLVNSQRSLFNSEVCIRVDHDVIQDRNHLQSKEKRKNYSFEKRGIKGLEIELNRFGLRTPGGGFTLLTPRTSHPNLKRTQ